MFPTLVTVLTKLARLQASFAPMVQETIYRLTRSIDKKANDYDDIRSGINSKNPSFSFQNYDNTGEDVFSVEEKNFEW